jgi:tetratricopeptide (TPR) repeat protein
VINCLSDTFDKALPEIDSLWDYQKPADSEARFRELLSQVPTNSEYYLELLTQIARAQGLQGKYSEAHATLDAVLERLTERDVLARTRYLLERGRVLNSSGKPSEGKPFFVQAWEIASSAGLDFYAVDAGHMIAIVENGENQIAWNYRALEMASASKDPRTRRWIGGLYNNLGWTYFDRQDYDKALELFQEALAAREDQQDLREIRIAKWCVAKTLRYLNRVPEALEQQQALLKEWEKTGTKPGYVYEEIGECMLTLGRRDESMTFFVRAYEELARDPWLAEHEGARLQRLLDLGRGSNPA